MVRILWVLLLALAGCAQLPPSPAEIEAKRFEPPPPGKSVIYLVRDDPDFTDVGASVMMGDRLMGTTFPGIFFRWVVEPGPHQIRGFAGDTGSFSLATSPGGMYFVQQRVTRFFLPMAQSQFFLVPEPHGRAAVMRSTLGGGQ